MGNQAGIHKEALEAIEKVKKSRNTSLSLRKLGLADVPRAVYESGWIQSLDLSSNKLLSLPEGLFSVLPLLQELYLERNGLTNLPSDISELTQLETLDLSSNRFDQIPECISTLQKLRNLVLNQNNITEIPAHISNLKALNVFRAEDNSITEISEDLLNNCLALREISLEGNKVSVVPASISNLTGLRMISLANNLLVEFPTALFANGVMHYAKLNNNQIKEFPVDLKLMKSFDQVDLRNNHIDDIPREVRWSTDFEGQLMTDIPDEILENLYLGPISASQNRLVLEKRKITHILRVVVGAPPEFPNDYKYKVIEVYDTHVDIKGHFVDAMQFIEEGRKNGAILVHCEQGKSRSASFVIAYLMYHMNISAEEALEMVKKRRPIARPNTHFQVQLSSWGSTCKIDMEGAKKTEL
jgi:hypothetical protein